MERGKRKARTGVVVSNKMSKTVVVEVERIYQHAFYHKVVRATTKFKVHDEENTCAIGDLVEIIETRPISRDKRWRIVKVLGKAKVKAHERPKKREKKEAAAEAVEPPIVSGEEKL